MKRVGRRPEFIAQFLVHRWLLPGLPPDIQNCERLLSIWTMRKLSAAQ
jgi:hypothetical protein